MAVEAQYKRCFDQAAEHGQVALGHMTGQAWRDDPKHLGFTLARYKFVSKMLAGMADVAEVGCGDGWASEIVRREVKGLTLYDLDPQLSGGAALKHDIASTPLPRQHRAIYSLDVIEHITGHRAVHRMIEALLPNGGRLIIGTPSAESQGYASPLSLAGHVNCRTGEQLRAELAPYFRHVLMFGMNDEVVHVGFMPMCHYLFAVCCEPR